MNRQLKKSVPKTKKKRSVKEKIVPKRIKNSFQKKSFRKKKNVSLKKKIKNLIFFLTRVVTQDTFLCHPSSCVC